MKFNKGDKIKRVRGTTFGSRMSNGKVFTIVEYNNTNHMRLIMENGQIEGGWQEDNFELVSPSNELYEIF